MPFITRYLHEFDMADGQTLMLNTLTSALDLVDAETHAKILGMTGGRRDITSESDPDLHAALVKRGYLFADHAEERAMLERMRMLTQAAPFAGVPTNFIICPTMGCNLRCTYCFESDAQHGAFEKMTPTQLEGIFSYILDCRAAYAEFCSDPARKRFMGDVEPTISLFGGEPLLRSNRDIVERVLAFAAAVPMPVKVITNGTTVRHYADLISRYLPLLRFQVTLDGAQTAHDQRRVRAGGQGTFHEVCAGVDALLALGAFVALRVNVDRDNVDQLGELRQVFAERGWDANERLMPYASVVQDFACDRPELLRESELLEALVDRGWYGGEQPLFRQLLSTTIGFVEGFFRQGPGIKPWKITYCEATSGSSFCFAPDGTVTTCLTYVGKGQYTIGSFDGEGVRIDPAALARWTQRDPFRMDRCQDCIYVLLCGGGCPVKSLQRHDDIDCGVCSDIRDTLGVYVRQQAGRLV